ncbi:hypothetical protein HDU92_005849 [Lobulomyces angularis]|nr:hypothetical protein HDU92_005849 [Lobulomyces angularis]
MGIPNIADFELENILLEIEGTACVQLLAERQAKLKLPVLNYTCEVIRKNNGATSANIVSLFIAGKNFSIEADTKSLGKKLLAPRVYDELKKINAPEINETSKSHYTVMVAEIAKKLRLPPPRYIIHSQNKGNFMMSLWFCDSEFYSEDYFSTKKKAIESCAKEAFVAFKKDYTRRREGLLIAETEFQSSTHIKFDDDTGVLSPSKKTKVDGMVEPKTNIKFFSNYNSKERINQIKNNDTPYLPQHQLPVDVPLHFGPPTFRPPNFGPSANIYNNHHMHTQNQLQQQFPSQSASFNNPNLHSNLPLQGVAVILDHHSSPYNEFAGASNFDSQLPFLNINGIHNNTQNNQIPNSLKLQSAFNILTPVSKKKGIFLKALEAFVEKHNIINIFNFRETSENKFICQLIVGEFELVSKTELSSKFDLMENLAKEGLPKLYEVYEANNSQVLNEELNKAMEVEETVKEVAEDNITVEITEMEDLYGKNWHVKDVDTNICPLRSSKKLKSVNFNEDVMTEDRNAMNEVVETKDRDLLTEFVETKNQNMKNEVNYEINCNKDEEMLSDLSPFEIGSCNNDEDMTSDLTICVEKHRSLNLPQSPNSDMEVYKFESYLELLANLNLELKFNEPQFDFKKVLIKQLDINKEQVYGFKVILEFGYKKFDGKKIYKSFEEGKEDLAGDALKYFTR